MNCSSTYVCVKSVILEIYFYFSFFSLPLTTANRDIGFPDGWEIVKDLQGYNDFTPPGVEISCVHGVGIQTLERMDFGNDFNNPTPGKVKGDGDGTVNYRSLSGCKHWSDQPAQGNYTINRFEIPNAEHYNILSDHRAINHILNELTLPGDYVPPPNQSTREPIMKIRIF